MEGPEAEALNTEYCRRAAVVSSTVLVASTPRAYLKLAAKFFTTLLLMR